MTTSQPDAIQAREYIDSPIVAFHQGGWYICGALVDVELVDTMKGCNKDVPYLLIASEWRKTTDGEVEYRNNFTVALNDIMIMGRLVPEGDEDVNL